MAKILIAEDERDIRDLIQFTLSYAGHEITAVANGQDAVDQAAVLMPDLVMLDVRMPKLTGFDACRALKANPQLRHIPVVILSGGGDAEREVGIQVGAVDFITKPFVPDELMRSVAEILQKVGLA
ncbi:MAG: response regulator transcription factor [Phototrophicaceae bacterium]|jgi:CheY-like chemotaxis protein